jgi:hypothetical protein
MRYDMGDNFNFNSNSNKVPESLKELVEASALLQLTRLGLVFVTVLHLVTCILWALARVEQYTEESNLCPVHRR